MRNMFFLFGALLLVDGVFGVNVTLSVIEGDSVTLNPQTIIPEDAPAEWFFGDLIIAQINKATGRFSTSEGDERFKGRLKLDNQTGSLTITNIRTDYNGVYTLKIRTTAQTLHDIFSVTVSDAVKSRSVTEGDTVTLHTGVTDIQRADQILWRFGDRDLNVPGDTRWRNIHRNNETGDLSIRNIRRDQSGDYELEINTSSMILHRKLNITISDAMKNVSVKEGESVTLNTGVTEIQGYDLLWMFGEDVIGDINKDTKHTYDSKDKRFNGRLQLIGKSGDLTISDSKTTDSGDYHLNMSSSSHTVQRNISVTVKAPPLSPGAVAGIVAGVLLLVFAAVLFAVVIYYKSTISQLQRLRNAENN